MTAAENTAGTNPQNKVNTSKVSMLKIFTKFFFKKKFYLSWFLDELSSSSSAACLYWMDSNLDLKPELRATPFYQNVHRHELIAFYRTMKHFLTFFDKAKDLVTLPWPYKDILSFTVVPNLLLSLSSSRTLRSIYFFKQRHNLCHDYVIHPIIHSGCDVGLSKVLLCPRLERPRQVGIVDQCLYTYGSFLETFVGWFGFLVRLGDSDGMTMKWSWAPQWFDNDSGVKVQRHNASIWRHTRTLAHSYWGKSAMYGVSRCYQEVGVACNSRLSDVTFLVHKYETLIIDCSFSYTILSGHNKITSIDQNVCTTCTTICVLWHICHKKYKWINKQILFDNISKRFFSWCCSALFLFWRIDIDSI